MTTRRMNILFVCMGNICRSPTAEGVFRQRHALQRGYDLSDSRARQIKAQDFEVFDLILTMDDDNLTNTLAVCPQPLHPKVQAYATLLRRHNATEIPDPYYGGAGGFDHVLDLIEDASDTLLDLTRQRLRQG